MMNQYKTSLELDYIELILKCQLGQLARESGPHPIANLQ